MQDLFWKNVETKKGKQLKKKNQLWRNWGKKENNIPRNRICFEKMLKRKIILEGKTKIRKEIILRSSKYFG